MKVSFETNSGKRANYFEPSAFRDLNLERHSTLRQGSILLGAVDGAPSTMGAKHSS